MGETSTAPACMGKRGVGSRNNLSITGIKKASVFPDPVTACEASMEESKGLNQKGHADVGLKRQLQQIKRK